MRSQEAAGPVPATHQTIGAGPGRRRPSGRGVAAVVALGLLVASLLAVDGAPSVPGSSIEQAGAALVPIASTPTCGSHFCAGPVLASATPSWGLSWGDVDADRYPDLFVSNHAQDPRLYRNQRNGTFATLDPTAAVDERDTHGAAVADLDGDGDGDVVEVVGWAGGETPGAVRLYRNAAERGGPVSQQALPADPLPAAPVGGLLPAETTPAYYDEVSLTSGVFKQGARGRSPLVVDWDGDGRLDLVYATERHTDASRSDLVGRFGSTVFVQGTDGRFRRATDLPTGFPRLRVSGDTSSEYAQLTWLSTSPGEPPRPALLLHDRASPGAPYRLRTATSAPADVRPSVGLPTTYSTGGSVRPIESVRDTVLGDFDNDGTTDLVLLADRLPLRSGATVSRDGRRLALVARERGALDTPVPNGWPSVPAARFGGTVGAALRLTVDPDWPPALYVGGAKSSVPWWPWPPGILQRPGTLVVDATAVGSPALGLPAVTAADPPGIYVGFADGTWQVAVVGDGRDLHTSMSLDGYGTFSGLQTNFGHLSGSDAASPEGQLPAVLVTDASPTDRSFGGYTARELPLAGGGGPGSAACTSGTALDVDNDGDLDLFLACGAPAANRPDVLYLNQLVETGALGFLRAGPGPTGAEGPDDAAGWTGPGDPSPTGAVDSVAAADWDLDGRVDLAVTNGGSDPPLDRGPVQLFRNTTAVDGRHWLAVDLRGAASNRDGIGARVTVTAGGRTQVREVSGMHRYSQDHARAHVGLGGAAEAMVTVSWPDGSTQTVGPVAADQLVTVTQGPPASGAALTDGAPALDPCRDRGVSLWRDPGSGRWRLRATAGGALAGCSTGPSASFSGTLLASQPVVVRDAGLLETAAPAPNTDEVIPAPSAGGASAPSTVVRFTMAMAGSGSDGIDFDIPTGTTVLLSVDDRIEAGQSAARPPSGSLVRLGPRRVPMAPQGWIVDPAALATSTALSTDGTRRAGLLVDRDGADLRARVTGNAAWTTSYPWALSLLVPQGGGTAARADGLEAGDVLTTGERMVSARGWCAGTWAGQPSVDGVRVPVPATGPVGVTFSYQGLVDGWWPTRAALGPPDTVRLTT